MTREEIYNDMAIILKDQGIEPVEVVTYRRMKDLYPRYVDISNRVQVAMGEPASGPDDVALITPQTIEYIHGLNNARSKLEMELYFELMFYEARERTIMFFKYKNPEIPDSRMETARDIYSKVIDKDIRPVVSNVANELF